MNHLEMEWIEGARNGDASAFCQLVEAYQTPVYNLCYRMMGEAGEAEDAAQEAFMRAYQSIKKYDPQRSFITWLLSIAAHYCIDQIRKQHMKVTSLDALPDEIISDGLPGPESTATRHENQDRMRNLLNSLEQQDRAAIILRYWYDFSEEEIASALSLTVSAVKSRLFRARKELARLYIAQQPEIERIERRPHESPAF